MAGGVGQLYKLTCDEAVALTPLPQRCSPPFLIGWDYEVCMSVPLVAVPIQQLSYIRCRCAGC